jgi:beta-carotene hydroxylase
MSESNKSPVIKLPVLHNLADDLTHISALRLALSLSLPFIWMGLYFLFAIWHWWAVSIACLVCLSFVTYGSISHDLVHGNLGLRRRTNDFLLTLIEMLALRSGHAYRLAHLHHHFCYPNDDDIEGAASKMSFIRTILEGVVFQPRIWCWAVRRSKRERRIIIMEGIGCITLVVLSILLSVWTPVFVVYVVLMIMGSWIIPLVTSYVPHDPHGENVLLQTRLFRGTVASLIAIEHLYHLEHHLYPSVPHHNWPELGRRLDPYFQQAGVRPIRFWF